MYKRKFTPKKSSHKLEKALLLGSICILFVSIQAAAIGFGLAGFVYLARHCFKPMLRAFLREFIRVITGGIVKTFTP